MTKYYYLIFIFFLACSSSDSNSSSITSTTSSTPSPQIQIVPGTSWQWQLTGPIDTSVEVSLYDIDLVNAPQSIIDELHSLGRIVICYFSAGTWEDFRPDSSAFPSSIRGNVLDDFPDEQWLDVRQIDLLAPIIKARLDLAVSKKCDGVEPDNMDGYLNSSGFNLSYDDQITYNHWIAKEAHLRFLSVGLKNDLEQIKDLVNDFDWALNEQCFEFDECSLLLPFIEAGKAVFGVEYTGSTNSFCPKANSMNFDWLKKNLSLDTSRIACR